MYAGSGETEEDNGESSFSFLRDRHGDKDQESDSEKSSGDEATSSGFSFLNTATKETEEREDDQQRETVDQKPPVAAEREEKIRQNDTSTNSKRDREPTTPSSDKSNELPSVPQPNMVKGEESSITGRSPLKLGGGRTAGRQLPPASGAVKKKKKKAVIPGKERMTASSGASNQTEPGSTSSSKSDLSSRIDDDTVAGHDEISEQSEQLVDITAPSSEHDGEEQAQSGDVTIKPTQDMSTIHQENVQSTTTPEMDVHSTATREEDVDMVTTEEVDTADTTTNKQPPTSEPVAVEKTDEEAESRALEEVFGNYRVELSGEESYTALIESYQSSIKKIR